MISKWPFDPKNLFFGIAVSPIRIFLTHMETGQNIDPLGFLSGVENEEFAVLFKLRMESQAEEAFLIVVIAVGDAFPNVEKDLRFIRLLVVREDMDNTVLSGDENAIAAVTGMGKDEWT